MGRKIVGSVKMKYKLGQQLWWVEAHTHFSKYIPCIMCYGKLFVTIILGDDSTTRVASTRNAKPIIERRVCEWRRVAQ